MSPSQGVRPCTFPTGPLPSFQAVLRSFPPVMQRRRSLGTQPHSPGAWPLSGPGQDAALPPSGCGRLMTQKALLLHPKGWNIPLLLSNKLLPCSPGSSGSFPRTQLDRWGWERAMSLVLEPCSWAFSTKGLSVPLAIVCRGKARVRGQLLSVCFFPLSRSCGPAQGRTWGWQPPKGEGPRGHGYWVGVCAGSAQVSDSTVLRATPGCPVLPHFLATQHAGNTGQGALYPVAGTLPTTTAHSGDHPLPFHNPDGLQTPSSQAFAKQQLLHLQCVRAGLRPPGMPGPAQIPLANPCSM